MRDLMVNTGNFEACDIPIRHKIIYEAHMQHIKGAPKPTQEILLSASQTTKDTDQSPVKKSQLSSSGSEEDLEIQGQDGRFIKNERSRINKINKHNSSFSMGEDIIEEIPNSEPFEKSIFKMDPGN